MIDDLTRVSRAAQKFVSACENLGDDDAITRMKELEWEIAAFHLKYNYCWQGDVAGGAAPAGPPSKRKGPKRNLGLVARRSYKRKPKRLDR